jgi:hypothetical protein
MRAGCGNAPPRLEWRELGRTRRIGTMFFSVARNLTKNVVPTTPRNEGPHCRKRLESIFGIYYRFTNILLGYALGAPSWASGRCPPFASSVRMEKVIPDLQQ